MRRSCPHGALELKVTLKSNNTINTWDLGHHEIVVGAANNIPVACVFVSLNLKYDMPCFIGSLI